MNATQTQSPKTVRSEITTFPDGLFFNEITKSFGGTAALKGVSMRVGPGEIEWMSIAENMAMAQGYRKRFGLIDWAECERATKLALERVGCSFSPAMRVSRLTRAEKSLVAIARALAVDCDYLVLDEPSASLPSEDVSRLFDVLRQLREDGVGMIYVSHRLDEVFQIADRVVVLRDGEMVGVRPVAHTGPEELVDMIVGKKPKTFSKVEPAAREPVMRLQDVHTQSAGPVSLDICQGEMPIDARSGGNQQKVIVGRWLASTNRVLIAEDPTAGVDVRAKAEIYTLLSEIVDSGVAVVIISTDFEEVATVANRAIVFNRGICAGELEGMHLTTEAWIQAASANEFVTDTDNDNAKH